MSSSSAESDRQAIQPRSWLPIRRLLCSSRGPMDRTIARAHKALIVFGGFYVLSVALLAIPLVQRHALYAHYIRWPLAARFDHPEQYGLSPSKTLNLNIHTSDNITLGAWFTFAEPAFQSLRSAGRPLPRPDSQDIHHALNNYKTVIFFHGNTASRAVPFRVQFYTSWSSKLEVNVLAIDYRGFADSEGVPSEEGLALDGRAAWDWAIANGARPDNIVLVGQSLGTGVAAKVAHRLSREGVELRGVVLIAGFTSIAKLLETYNIAGFLPLMQPLQLIPMAFKAVDHILEHKFNTLSIVPNITSPIVFVHSNDDFDISVAHSQTLYEALLEPHLPAIPYDEQDIRSRRVPFAEMMSAIKRVNAERAGIREQVETVLELGNVGKVMSFTRPQSQGGRSATFLKTNFGGHNMVICQETVMDIVRDTLDL